MYFRLIKSHPEYAGSVMQTTDTCVALVLMRTLQIIYNKPIKFTDMKKSTKFWLYNVLFQVILLMMTVSGSKKSDTPASPLPVLTTTARKRLFTMTTANSGGNVTFDRRICCDGWGICWKYFCNPTVSDQTCGGGAVYNQFLPVR